MPFSPSVCVVKIRLIITCASDEVKCYPFKLSVNAVVRDEKTKQNKFITFILCMLMTVFSKSKLELKSNFSEILPVNCKFIHDSIPTYSDKTQT